MTEAAAIAKFALNVLTASHFIADLYRRNLTIAVPFTILLIKFLVRWLSREKIKDVFKTILVVPLDFVYIAIGLVLTGLVKRVPEFVSNYKSESDVYFNVIILLILLIALAVVITWLDRGVRLFWQKWYAAWQVLKDEPQMSLIKPDDGIVVPDSFLKTLFWVVLYWTLLSVVFSVEVILSFGSLGGILRLYK